MADNQIDEKSKQDRIFPYIEFNSAFRKMEKQRILDIKKQARRPATKK